MRMRQTSVRETALEREGSLRGARAHELDVFTTLLDKGIDV